MDRERLHQEVDSAGWEPDGSFSDHQVIGNKGDLCLPNREDSTLVAAGFESTKEPSLWRKGSV
jgi:hypothetical protein